MAGSGHTLVFLGEGGGDAPGDRVLTFTFDDSGRVLVVLNPSTYFESNDDDTGRGVDCADWGSWSIDGRNPTEEEEREFGDPLRRAVLDQLPF